MILEAFTCDRGRHKLRNSHQLKKYKVSLSEVLPHFKFETLAELYASVMGENDLLCVRCRRRFTAHGYLDGSGKQTKGGFDS